jgi:hypothetical protein
MRIVKLLILLAAGAALLAGPVLAAETHAAAPATPAAFDHLKALTGSWEAKSPDGKVTHATYEVYAGGTAVVEKFQAEGEPAMVTVYYPDRGQVMLTHYCTIGNQPRMRSKESGDGKQLKFTFVDASNMKGPTDAHMHGVAFSFTDADHYSQTWTMKNDGKEIPLTLSFERAK